MLEHTQRDSDEAGEWFNCNGCQRRRKYRIHGPAYWLIGVHSRPAKILCSQCGDYKVL